MAKDCEKCIARAELGREGSCPEHQKSEARQAEDERLQRVLEARKNRWRGKVKMKGWVDGDDTYQVIDISGKPYVMNALATSEYWTEDMRKTLIEIVGPPEDSEGRTERYREAQEELGLESKTLHEASAYEAARDAYERSFNEAASVEAITKFGSQQTFFTRWDRDPRNAKG